MANINYTKPDKLEDFSAWCSKKYPLWCKSNFPFIEDTFEALDTYGLICKIVQYLNEIKQNLNTTEENVQNIYDFVTNYFDNLDVQNEINNKLDEMVKNGSLTELIDNYFTEINNKLNSQDEKITELTENTPIFVSSTDDMIDNNKIYVLSTNNHIYQYSNTENSFVDTGAIYSNVENGLPLYSTLITKANYAEILPNLNLATSSHIYELLFAQNDQNIPQNLPCAPYGKLETLFVLKFDSAIKQIYFSFNKIYSRFKIADTWSNWEEQVNYNNPRIITNSNYSTYLPDINQITETKNYFLRIPFTETSQKPANLPDSPMTGNLEILMTEIINTENAYQILMSNQYIFIRFKYSNNWSSWEKISGNYNLTIGAGNFTYFLPDLNNIDNTNAFSLLFSKTATNLPLNLPVTPSSQIELLYNFKYSDDNAYQIYFTNDNIFTRWKYKGTWENWNNFKEKIKQDIQLDFPQTIYVGQNEDFTTLKSAVEYATQFKNCKVFVKEGIYDLYQEFGGDNFFDNYTDSSSKGLILSNGIHLIFSSNSKVIFNNTSSNNTADTIFSPFNSGENGFTIENLTIYTSRCRYSIHDERGSSNEQYINVIKNCNFKHDNSQGGYGACIGGGLGKNGEITIENCIFDNPNIQNDYGVLSYHNNNSPTETQSKSKVIIKNNYFKNGTIRASWCGVSTLISTFIITNNKINSEIIHKAERTQDVTENTEIFAWNNTIKKD